MAKVRLLHGKPLLVGGKVALSDDCCCGGEFTCPSSITVRFTGVNFCPCIAFDSGFPSFFFTENQFNGVNITCNRISEPSCDGDCAFSNGLTGVMFPASGLPEADLNYYADSSDCSTSSFVQTASFALLVVRIASTGLWSILIYGQDNFFAYANCIMFLGEGTDQANVPNNLMPPCGTFLFDNTSVSSALIDCVFGGSFGAFTFISTSGGHASITF